MSKKDEFKIFVKSHPELIEHIKKGETWQKFYEIYDMYGEDSKVWKDYLGTSSFKMGEVLASLKNVNLDEVEKGIDNIQKVLGMLGDIKGSKATYNPRPIYKHFDD